MKITAIIAGIIVAVFGLGYLGIAYTKTITKQQQNAEREAYEQSNSFVKAKRAEAIKLYNEWMRAEEDGKKSDLRKTSDST